MNNKAPLTSPPAASTAGDLSAHPNRSARPWLLRALLVLVLLSALLIGYRLLRLGLYGWAAYQSATELLAIVESGPALDDAPALLPTVETHIAALADSATGVEQQVRFFAPLLRAFEPLPTYGATIAAAPELLRAGREGLALAEGGLGVLEPVAATMNEGAGVDALLTSTLDAVAEQRRAFDEMAVHATGLVAALDDMPRAGLHPAVGERLATVDPLLPLLAPALHMAPDLPLLVGMDSPHTYLVLVQNNHELRATGGFITAVGTLTLDQGQPTAIDFTDSYDFERRDIKYGWLPEPMQRYMDMDLLLLRDANWSPDLSTAARMIGALYTQQTGQSINGVVSLDLSAAELLIDALGPFELDGFDEPVTGETVVEQMKSFRDDALDIEEGEITGDWGGRKDFMPTLAAAALERVQTGDVDPVRVVEAGLRALDERSIQIWVQEERSAEALATLGWDGALRAPSGGDFVALVDSNLGFNKVDMVIERALEHSVTWSSAERAAATTTVTYRHALEVPDHTCDLTPRYGDTYDEQSARCYYNYVRLYVPLGSELISIDGVDEASVESQRGEGGTQRFAGYFVMKPGSTHRATFRYTLPDSVRADDYALIVQRQAGTAALPLSLDINGTEVETIIEAGRFAWSR